MLETYSLALWGLWLMLFTLIVQTGVASVAHRRQSQYVPGVVSESLGHESIVFRSHRTFQNSLENIVMMLGPALLGLLSGMNPVSLAACIWVYAIARIIHMVLYYAIATEKNPSPRSYFYMIGLLSNLVLFILLAIHLAS